MLLVPDKFLIQQVVNEANDAKIPVTTDAKDESFRSSQAILVTTFHKLLNGRSTFGVRGVKEIIPLGVVVIDDAHSALNATRGLFAASIPSSCDAFDRLLNLFAADLQDQSPKAFADICAGDFGAPIRVPPKAVADRDSEVLNVIQPYANDDAIESLFYSWPFVANSLKLATVTFTSRNVEIKTPCPEVALIPAFRQAKRRVYLSATLEDEGVLATELDADTEAVRKPITPKQASDLGDRIILAPLSIIPQRGVRMTRRKGGPSTLSITGDSDFIADLHSTIGEDSPLEAVDRIFFRGGATRPVASTNIVIHLDELDEILNGGGEEVTLQMTNGAEISGAKLVEKKLAEVGLVTLIHPFEGPVNLYRTSRFASEKQRLMAAAENPSCPWVECNYPADKCQVHHLQAWKHGGETNMDNLTIACPYHNGVNDDDPHAPPVRGRLHRHRGRIEWLPPWASPPS